MAVAEPPIEGDVETSSVTINKKGGSLTAILRKALRDKLGAIGSKLTAASIEMVDGRSAIVLVNGDDGGRPVHISRTDDHGWTIGSSVDDAADPIDDVTAAFLRLKKQQFLNDELDLAKPVAADEWEEEASIFAAKGAQAADRIAGKLKRGGMADLR